MSTFFCNGVGEMGNGIRISKEAFLNAGNGEVNRRRDAQREMLFDGILYLEKKIDKLPESLDKKFASKKDVKWLTWGFRAVYTSLLISIVLTILKYSLELRSFGN